MRSAAAALAGVATALLIGGLPGLLAGAATVLGLARWLAGLEPAASRRARERISADLPTAADLLAAGVSAGAAVDDVTAAIAEAVGGPLGSELRSVVAAIRLGADPAAAWSRLGSSLQPPTRYGFATADTAGLMTFGRAVARALDSGAPLASALTRLAEDQRSRRRAAAEIAARRAGVLAVVPLAACFLPAFVLVGVVPVVTAVAGAVFATRA